ncbi:MAG: glutathione S-transferase [Pseudomonadota bacterium]
MAINPLNKIPTLVTDDGMVLFDSTAICEFLDSLHDGPRLFPTGPRRALARAAPACDRQRPARYPDPVAQRADAARAAARARTARGLRPKARRGVGAARARGRCARGGAGGDRHIGVGAALGYLDFRFADRAWRDGHPRLTAWYDDFAQRPSMRATTPHD